ncbi:MAG TPA: hypothetical protein VF889_05650 [Bacteroidota bacterium]
MKGLLRTLPLLLLLAAAEGRAQEPDQALPPANLRIAVAGGLGVSYIRAGDLVTLVNGTSGALERVADFRSAAEFFAAGTIPLTSAWMLKIEYAYLLASYSVGTSFGTGVAQYTLGAHLPTLILHRVLVSNPMYDLKAGAGVGFHVGTVSRSSFLLDDNFSARGLGVVLDLEGDTAVSEHLFAFLDACLRWEWMGNLRDSQGRGPAGPQGGAVTLNVFGPGAKIGVAYLF